MPEMRTVILELKFQVVAAARPISEETEEDEIEHEPMLTVERVYVNHYISAMMMPRI